jgi:hypothetical protein
MHALNRRLLTVVGAVGLLTTVVPAVLADRRPRCQR